MKKRFPAIILALALCVGLVSPALAFGPPSSFQEAFQDVTLSYPYGGGVYDAFYTETWVDKSWPALTYDFDADFDTVDVVDIQDGYYAIPADTEFTLTFNDSKVGDNSLIRVYVESFANYGDGRYEQVEWPHSFYLTNDGSFIPNYVDPESSGGLLELKAGESVKFTLPGVYEYGDYDPVIEDYPATEITDVVHRLTVDKWYPDTAEEVTDEYGDTYTSMYHHWWYISFKEDNAAMSGFQSRTAYANTQTVLLDGKPVTFETYALKDANGNLANYIKLRDLAHYLNGTKAQFEVEWSAAQGISLIGGKAYSPNGSELSTPFSGSLIYDQLSGQTIVNGKGMDLDAISLSDGRYTYYKLRDLGRALNFNVSYINGQIVINTSEPYSDAQ